MVWVRIPIVELSTFFGSFRKLGLGFNAGLLLQDDRNPAADNFFYSGTFDGDVQMRVGQKPGQEYLDEFKILRRSKSTFVQSSVGMADE